MENHKRKKHIAFYIGSLYKGGAERVFVNLAEYFLQEGYQVTMVTQYQKENEYELPKGIIRRLIHYFTTYKDIPGENTQRMKFISIYNADVAKDVIRRSMEDYEELIAKWNKDDAGICGQ